MRLLTLALLASLPLLASCSTFGADRVWASPDSTGDRDWVVFPRGSTEVSCVAKYSSGRGDRTIAVGMRKCKQTGCASEKVPGPQFTSDGKVLIQNEGVVALSEYSKSTKGIGSTLNVTFNAVDQDGKPAALPAGNYECFLVTDGPSGESTASLVTNSANYDAFGDFVVSAR